jgi:hypothetical protein
VIHTPPELWGARGIMRYLLICDVLRLRYEPNTRSTYEIASLQAL